MDASNDKALTALLDAFGAAFSIDEIASVYRKSGRNAAAAADALSDDIEKAKTMPFSSKAKSRSASMGTVSGVIGKHYVRKTTSDCNGGKAVRVDMKAKVLPVPESWAAEEKVEKAESCGSGDDVLHKDMEDFLFTMLGEGFELQRDLIRDVLDSCGYDMEKSMADLISLSTSDSDESKEVICNSSDQSAGSCLEVEVSSQGESIKSTEMYAFSSLLSYLLVLISVYVKRWDLASLLGLGFAWTNPRVKMHLRRREKGNKMGECILALGFFQANPSPSREAKSEKMKGEDVENLIALYNDGLTDLCSTCCSNGDRAPNKNGVELNGKEKKRIDLPKELLAALFSAPEKPEEPELLRERVVRRSRYAAYGNLVDGPLKETFLDSRTPVVYRQNRTEDDADDEERYQVLRKSVKEYRSTMKEYYQAAVEAFSKGDRVRAAKLVEEGQFFQKKGRDADEESNKMIFKPGNAETQENIVLDLQDGGAKEAIRLLKRHLSSFAGISSIKHLKVIIDSKEGDSKKGTRRRLAVLRLLDEESIKWEEEENAGTLLIQMESEPKEVEIS